MDDFEKVADYIGKLEDEGKEAMAEAVAKTAILEEFRMTEGEEEVLPPMTMEELDTFLSEEDADIKEGTIHDNN